jgi:hypothetical protein
MRFMESEHFQISDVNRYHERKGDIPVAHSTWHLHR